MSEAPKALDVTVNLNDKPLDIDRPSGLREAIDATAEDQEDRVVTPDEERFTAYIVFWNEATERVRVAKCPTAATYEVPGEEVPADE